MILLLESGRVPFASWIYRGGRWRRLGDLDAYCRRHPDYEAMPEASPSKEESRLLDDEPAARSMGSAGGGAGGSVSAEPVWFVIRSRKKFGPFSAAEIVGQLQRKAIDSNAFVWRPGFETWQRLSGVREFSRETMRRLVSDSTPVDILVKRKYPRAPYEVEIIAHDNTRAIEGKSMVIGEGGLFLATPHPTHRVGSRLKLHFREGDAASFNAVAEVVSVVHGASSGYCLRFVALSDADRKRISKFVSEKVK